MRPAIFLASALALSAVTQSQVSKSEVPPIQRSAFAKQIDSTFEMLERDFSLWPEKLQYEQVSACKKTVREMLEAIRSDEDARYFTSKMAEQLAAGDKFRFFEYYLLWIGHRAIEKHPIQELRTWDALATKITAAKNLTPHDELNSEIAAFGIETMLVVFPYADPSPIGNEGVIDWTRWQAMEKWYRTSRNRFKFSTSEGTFILEDPTEK